MAFNKGLNKRFRSRRGKVIVKGRRWEAWLLAARFSHLMIRIMLV